MASPTLNSQSILDRAKSLLSKGVDYAVSSPLAAKLNLIESRSPMLQSAIATATGKEDPLGLRPTLGPAIEGMKNFLTPGTGAEGAVADIEDDPMFGMDKSTPPPMAAPAVPSALTLYGRGFSGIRRK